MALDMTKIGAQREEAQKLMGGRGNFWKVPEGETKIYLHGQCDPNDKFPATAGCNFIKIGQHFGVGGKKGGQICLNLENNPVLLHPRIVAAVANRKKNAFKLDKNLTCPVCEATEAGTLGSEDLNRMQLKLQYVFGLTPMYYRQGKLSDWVPVKFSPTRYIASGSVFEILTGEMMDAAPIDITDMMAATFIRLIRHGKDFSDTKYEGKLDMETSKKAVALDKGQRKAISEAMAEGGLCDLFKVVANLVRSPSALKALLSGVQVDEDEGEEASDKKLCFGVDFVADDKECKQCDEYAECGEAKGEPSAKTKPAKSPKKAYVELPKEEPKEEPDEAENEDTEPSEETGDEVEAVVEEESDQEVEAIDEAARPPCFGTFEDGNADCNACDDKNPCSIKVRDDLRKRASSLAKPTGKAVSAGAKGKGKIVEESQDDDDDPELAALEKEAKTLQGKRGKR